MPVENVEILNKNQLRALVHELHKLPITLKNKVLVAGTRAAANVIKRKARALVPVGKGLNTKAGGALRRRTRKKTLHLRDTIRTTKFRDPNSNIVRYIVHAGRGRATAHLVEFGTSPHPIKVSRGHKRMVLFGKYMKQVSHPGSKARPFMRPAFDEGAPQSIQVMIKKINEKLLKRYGVKR